MVIGKVHGPMGIKIQLSLEDLGKCGLDKPR